MFHLARYVRKLLVRSYDVRTNRECIHKKPPWLRGFAEDLDDFFRIHHVLYVEREFQGSEVQGSSASSDTHSAFRGVRLDSIRKIKNHACHGAAVRR